MRLELFSTPYPRCQYNTWPRRERYERRRRKGDRMKARGSERERERVSQERQVENICGVHEKTAHSYGNKL